MPCALSPLPMASSRGGWRLRFLFFWFRNFCCSQRWRRTSNSSRSWSSMRFETSAAPVCRRQMPPEKTSIVLPLRERTRNLQLCGTLGPSRRCGSAKSTRSGGGASCSKGASTCMALGSVTPWRPMMQSSGWRGAGRAGCTCDALRVGGCGWLQPLQSQHPAWWSGTLTAPVVARLIHIRFKFLTSGGSQPNSSTFGADFQLGQMLVTTDSVDATDTHEGLESHSRLPK